MKFNINELKMSPLAKPINEDCLEEVAIWANLNISTVDDLICIFKTIVNSYHEHNDWINISPSNNRSSFLASLNISFDIEYFSTKAFFWLFNLISKTDVFHSFAIDKKFKQYAKSMKTKCMKQIVLKKTQSSIAPNKLSYNSSKDLYEVFAELVDILNVIH